MSDRIVVFGNSGSGKSTYASRLASTRGLAHLDLDTLAWEPEAPPRRRPLAESRAEIQEFIDREARWVIEGCYADLLRSAAGAATQAVWLRLSVEDCIANARARPWETHKYASKAAQDANLEMLIEWIRAYESRDDEFSLRAHQELWESFDGDKSILYRNASPEAG